MPSIYFQLFNLFCTIVLLAFLAFILDGLEFKKPNTKKGFRWLLIAVTVIVLSAFVLGLRLN